MGCPPAHAVVYNRTQCACIPGYLLNAAANTCAVFADRIPAVELSTGVEYTSTLSFPVTILPFDYIKKFTQSQAVFLEATLFSLLSWLAFCLILRFLPLGSDGRSTWFKIRWWISRLDISFAARHWLHDQKPLVKRKTELGGAFSIAAWILFIGLFAALLYQVISKRSVEVHNIRAVNSPDLDSFKNDFEFNITTISSMNCAHLRGLGTIVKGNPLFIDHRVLPLSTFANYSCLNTTLGPTISLKCNNCRLIRDYAYISWNFVDLPNSPATAVGFQFNLTAKDHDNDNHLSYVSGILKHASDFDNNRSITYRGVLPNILKFNLFPRLYRNLRDLKLIQPLFQDFLAGSYFGDASQLQASLERPSDGLINTTLCINLLSSYIVEIDRQNIFGPVSFLADLGGLYCISISIFFFFLVQCEYRIKKLRNEDSVMIRIRNRRKAQDHWNKVRIYVQHMGFCPLEDSKSETDKTCCSGVMKKSFRPSERRRLQSVDGISFSRKVSLPSQKKEESENVGTQEVRSFSTEPSINTENRHVSQDVNKT